jgi:serine/threonine protein phosphatase PrpC
MCVPSSSRAMGLTYEAVQIVLCSQAGATHRETHKPCQDASVAVQQFYKGHPYTVLAVADGHGGPAYTRSEVGAHLAMQAVLSATTRFLPYVVELAEEQPAAWRWTAQREFRRYFGRWVRREWELLVLGHRRQQAGESPAGAGDVFKPYGTTLAVLLLYDDLAFAGAIGDSDIYVVQSGDHPAVSRAFPEDSALLRPQTHSLSSPDAPYQWQTLTVSLADLGMVVLTTDGFTKSLEYPEAAVQDMYEKVKVRGSGWLKDVLPLELMRWSDDGAGDDISVIACAVMREQPRQSRLKMMINRFSKPGGGR